LVLASLMVMRCVSTRRRQGYTPDVEAPQKDVVVSELDQMWRTAFISKVYGILVVQLFVTVGISYLMMEFGGAKLMMWMMTDGSWTFIASFVGLFASLCALMCYKEKVPHNFILLIIFTLTMSWTVGTTCTLYAARGYSALVVEAFAITSLIFVALTLFTIYSKMDFSWLGAVLYVFLMTFIFWGFFAMFAFPTFMFSQVYSLIGALIFALYVVYDTWLITKTLTYDQYIFGAVSLYLDFINLFLMILRLLSGGSRD